MDFGAYRKSVVLGVLKSKKGSGVCDRCGRSTRTKTIFGMTICNSCWSKQYPKR